MSKKILLSVLSLVSFHLFATDVIVLMSDSTAVDYRKMKNYYKKPWEPMAGWGEYTLHDLRKGVVLRNYAAGGYSSKSYYNSRFPYYKRGFVKGGWLLLSFGSNDARPHPKWDRVTQPETTYPEYLEKIASEALKAGMKVVILSPLPYFMYADGKFRNSVLEPYAAAAKKLAAEKNYYFIDLFQLVTDKFQTMSQEEIKSYYMFLKKGDSPNWPSGVSDPLHFTRKGAAMVWQIILEAIRKDIPELAKYFKTPAAE